MSEYFDFEGKRFTVTEVESMPYGGPRSTGMGKWEWLRKLVVDRRPGNKPLRIQFKNKHEAECGRVAVQNMVKGRKGHGPTVSVLAEGYTVRTVVQSVNGLRDGEYFLFVCVDSAA